MVAATAIPVVRFRHAADPKYRRVSAESPTRTYLPLHALRLRAKLAVTSPARVMRWLITFSTLGIFCLAYMIASILPAYTGTNHVLLSALLVDLLLLGWLYSLIAIFPQLAMRNYPN